MNANKRQPGLGRGLGELFQRTEPRPADPAFTAADDADGVVAPAGPSTAPAETASEPLADGSRFAEIPVDDIRPNPKQPRTVFDEDQMREMVESIREIGLLQPVVVRPVQDRYELVMGERRFRAAREAGLATIPAVIRETSDDALLRDALLENLHRVQLNPLEEAAAYQQLLDEFGCTQEELARRIKRSRPQISNTIRLLRLPPTVQRRVAAGVLSAGHARALLAITDHAGQERLAQRIVAEGLSVRAAEELVTLGEAEARVAPPRAPREQPVKASELSDHLSDFYETRVKVTMGRNRGRITIDFASDEDLDRIVAKMRLNGDAST